MFLVHHITPRRREAMFAMLIHVELTDSYIIWTAAIVAATLCCWIRNR